MYNIIQTNDDSGRVLELSSGANLIYIEMDRGARIKSWFWHGLEIISNLGPLPYKNTYAGAILFPFVNRVKDGRFRFRGSEYYLNNNDAKNNCALHGFVYNQSFDLQSQTATNNDAIIKLAYIGKGLDAGFPFKYLMILKISLDDNTLKLDIDVSNTGDAAFPFTVGWHPYFNSSNLKSSRLTFDSKSKIEVDEQLITESIQPYREKIPFMTESKNLDNCYELQQNPVIFETPNYRMLLTTDSDRKFLQFYTPPIDNVIAIEPTTGISNSFNNGEGLQILDPGDQYSITWNVTLESISQH